MIFQFFFFHFHDFGVPRSLESRHLLFGDIAVCGILLVCIGPVQKEQFLHLPNFGLKDDRSGNAKRSRPWSIFDSLHSNPQTGLARYNEIFDRDAFVYDRTRTWQQHHSPVSVKFFPLEASLIDSQWAHQSLPGTLLTTGDSQTAGTFGASPVGLLPGAYFYATLCVPSRCLHVTKLQYVTSVYCMRVLECTLHMPSINSRCSKLSSMSSVQTKLGFGLVPRMPRASSEQVKNSMCASVDSIWLHGLDMSNMSRTVMYLSAAQSCDAYWPTELVMFSVKFKSFGFFWKYLKIGYHPKENNVNNIIFPWPWPFGVSPLSDSPIWGQHFSVRQSGQDSCVDSRWSIWAILYVIYVIYRHWLHLAEKLKAKFSQIVVSRVFLPLMIPSWVLMSPCPCANERRHF